MGFYLNKGFLFLIRIMTIKIVFWCLFLLLCSLSNEVTAWNQKHEKVKLKDVQGLTLQHGRMTTGRRSSPVPQLSCVGGSAGCHGFKPKSVQCYNKGFDGIDYQWECKTDMDDSYRFGMIKVSCEGFEYPDDPYILAGSCGLDYQLDLTKSGHKRKNNGGGHRGYRRRCSYTYNSSSRSSLTDYIPVFIFVSIVVVILILTKCSKPESSPNQDGPGGYGHGGPGGPPGGPNAPPPYGFKPEYTSAQSPPPYPGTGNYNQQQQQQPNSNSGRPGFWTGLFSGALGSYLLNSRGRSRGNYDSHYGGH